MQISNNVRLDALSYFRLPATAHRLIQTHTREGLQQALAHYADAPTLVLGGGSNTVFLEHFPGTILRYRGRGMRTSSMGAEHVQVTVGAGENWHSLVLRCCHAGWHGLENLALIPGACGAAPVQNIGAYGVEIAERLESLTAIDRHDNQIVRLNNAECAFAYRDSLFKQNPTRYIITDITLKLDRHYQAVVEYADLAKRFADQTDSPHAHSVMQAVIAIRQEKLPDPRQTPNCGSFFKNPIIDNQQLNSLRQTHPVLPTWPVDARRTKLSAGWLIEQCKLRGYCVGDAAVSERHALVLINRGAATASQLAQLIDTIRARVHQQFGIWLEPEPRLITARGVVDASVPIATQIS